jgi:hypothetical protein
VGNSFRGSLRGPAIFLLGSPGPFLLAGKPRRGSPQLLVDRPPAARQTAGNRPNVSTPEPTYAGIHFKTKLVRCFVGCRFSDGDSLAINAIAAEGLKIVSGPPTRDIMRAKLYVSKSQGKGAEVAFCAEPASRMAGLCIRAVRRGVGMSSGIAVLRNRRLVVRAHWGVLPGGNCIINCVRVFLCALLPPTVVALPATC